MKTLRSIVLLAAITAASGCKKCTQCSMQYDTPVGGLTEIRGEKYCGKETEITRYEAGFTNQYQKYGTIKCARD